MRPIHIPLNYRLTSGAFDARVALLIGYLAAVSIIPAAILALIRHPGSRADFLLGLGLAVLMALLFMMLGLLSRQIEGVREKMTMRSRVPEFASYVACIGILIMGLGSLASLNLTPVQVTLGLLLLCSLSIAVLVLGMMTTVVRSMRTDRSSPSHQADRERC
jgi:hypothetical protein